MDIYSTRAQLAAIEAQPRVYSWLYDTFVQEMGCVEDDKAIYDYMKGDTPMAPFVVPGTGGVLLPRNGYETREIGFAQIAPERVITNNDLKGRAFGEKVLGALTPEQREKRMLVRDQMELRASIQRRREWMARQVLLTGKLEIFEYTDEGRNKKANKMADYKFTNVFTPALAWSEANSHPEEDMQAMFEMVYEGLGSVEIMVMDLAAASALLNNVNFTKKLNILNMNVGEIATRYMGQGVRYLGTTEDGVEMYAFSGKFTDDDGLRKPILSKGTLIAGSRQMLKGFHGPVTQVEAEGQDAAHKTYIKKEVPLRYGSINSNAIKERITSCPTIVPANVDGWAVANVL